MKANDYAREHGMAQFAVCELLHCVLSSPPHLRLADQGAWNIKERDLEREILPMCRAEGMGIVPWGVLGQVRT